MQVNLNFHPVVNMRLLPGAIEYKKRLEAAGNKVRITVDDSQWLHDFLLPYQIEGASSAWIENEPGVDIIKPPIFASGPDKRSIKEIADQFFRSNINQFFVNTGFPSSSRGRFLQKLYSLRLRRQHGLFIYYVPMVSECDAPHKFDIHFWTMFFDFCEKKHIPAMSHTSLLPLNFHHLASKCTLVESSPHLMQIWEIACNLLMARLFVGGCSVLSELAMLLDVPCIIFPKSGNYGFPLERKANVQYVEQSKHGGVSWEEFQNAYFALEGMLVHEH
jgi:hypothetical protein